MTVIFALVFTVPCTITIGHRASLSLCHPQRGGVGHSNVLYNVCNNQSTDDIDNTVMLSISQVLDFSSMARQPWRNHGGGGGSRTQLQVCSAGATRSRRSGRGHTMRGCCP